MNSSQKNFNIFLNHMLKHKETLKENNIKEILNNLLKNSIDFYINFNYEEKSVFIGTKKNENLQKLNDFIKENNLNLLTSFLPYKI